MIRRAVLGDESDILDIYVDSFSNEWSVEEIRESLSRDYVVILMSHDDATLECNGFICYYTSGDLLYVAVKPKYRRQGVALQMIRHALAAAMAQNVDYLYLEVRKTNRAAIALYETAGFDMIAERADYYENNEPALIYKRELK